MKKKIINIITISLINIILTASCSYQKMNSLNQKKFDIQEFEIYGDTREAFVIQKKIQRFSNKNAINKIKIFIDLKKDKSIKEKNIQNKVTKYNISLIADLKIIELNSNKEVNRIFKAEQIYGVDDSYSSTVNNAKEANNSLIDTIVNEILDHLRIYYK
tara:strand:- start:311 stop:787 length:477 start_codon:yes stop_codon:yes gene_type:complete